MQLMKIDKKTSLLLDGFSNIDLGDSKKKLEEFRLSYPQVCLQLMDARYVAGALHLELVGVQVHEAQKRGQLIAEKADLDLLMRIACNTRISESLKNVGLHKGVRDAALLAIGPSKTLKLIHKEMTQTFRSDASVLDLTPEKTKLLRRLHGITSTTLSSVLLEEDKLPFLLAERAALLARKDVRTPSSP